MCLLAPCRLAFSMYRREQALKDIPGPKHPFLLGMMVDLVCRRDPHRYATELAEQYGPIFKFRLLIFHVRSSVQTPLPKSVVLMHECHPSPSICALHMGHDPKPVSFL